MPTVPGVPDNQVRLNPLSRERFDAPDIGAGGRMIGEAMQRLGGAIGRTAQDLDDIDTMQAEARAKRADVEYQDYERERLLGTDGFYTKQSADAIDAQRTVAEDLQKKRAELLARATGKERAMLETVLTRRGQEAADGIARHTIGETRRFNVEQIGSRISSAKENYATYADIDPERAQAELDTARGEFARLADLNGWNDPAILTQKREEMLSDFHMTYLEAAALRDPVKAAAYLERHRGEMNHADEMKMDATLRPMLVEADATAVADLASAAGVEMPVVGNAEGDAPGTPVEAGSTEGVWRAMVGDNNAAGGRFRGAEGGTDPKTGRFLTSPAGAIGPAQVMPGTAREMAAELGLKWDEKRYKSDFGYNMMLGKGYFAKMLRTFGGDVAKAVAAYNAGPGGVNRAVRRAGANWRSALPKETRQYLVNVLGANARGGAAMTPTSGQQIASSEAAQIEWAERYIPEKFADKPPLYVQQVLEKTKAEIRQRHQEQRATIRETEAAQWDAVQDSVADQGGWEAITSTSQIPGYNQLPGAKKNQVLNVVNANRKAAASGTEIETDWSEYARYSAMTPKQLEAVPVDELRRNLGDTEFKELAKKRGKGEKVDAGKPVTYNSILSVTAEPLRAMGLSLTGLKEKDAKVVRAKRSEFLGDMSNWANNYHRAHGKWPDDLEIQKKADGFLLRGRWTDEDGDMVSGFMFEAPEDRMGADTPYKDRVQVVVPADIRQRIINANPDKRLTAGEIHRLYVLGRKRGSW